MSFLGNLFNALFGGGSPSGNAQAAQNYANSAVGSLNNQTAGTIGDLLLTEAPIISQLQNLAINPTALSGVAPPVISSIFGSGGAGSVPSLSYGPNNYYQQALQLAAQLQKQQQQPQLLTPTGQTFQVQNAGGSGQTGTEINYRLPGGEVIGWVSGPWSGGQGFWSTGPVGYATPVGSEGQTLLQLEQMFPSWFTAPTS